MRFYAERGFYLEMTKEQARSASHPGPCDRDIEALARVPKIARQLAKLDPHTLAQELWEYGAWNDEELSDHSDNLHRILWIAAGYIVNNL